MRRVLLIVGLVVLVLPATSGAAVRLGIAGDKPRFHRQTGQASQVHLFFATWNGGLNRPDLLDGFFSNHTPIPMVALDTKNSKNKEAITPLGIARGLGDHYLVQMSKAAHRFGSTSYVRPLAEMNGHWNFYSAYNSNGSYRGTSHSTKNFKQAFRRIYLIMHGGLETDINDRLRSLRMHALRTQGDIPENPFVRVLWNPQGFGSPNIPKNSANSYYPGNRYVDLVGNDLYDINHSAAWDANLKLFNSHPSKPYAIGEWGLWGLDDPAFIKRMAQFVRSHHRVETIVWFKAIKGSMFDLGSKPKSLAAYKKYIVPLG